MYSLSRSSTFSYIPAFLLKCNNLLSPPSVNPLTYALTYLLPIWPPGFVQSLEFLKKSWNLSSNFSDLEKVWKMELKSGKMVKSLDFFFKATTSASEKVLILDPRTTQLPACQNLSAILTTFLQIPTYHPSHLPPVPLILQSTNAASHLIHLPTFLPTYLPTYLASNLLTNLPTYLPTYLPTCQPTYIPTYRPTNLRIYVPIYLPT